MGVWHHPGLHLLQQSVFPWCLSLCLWLFWPMWYPVEAFHLIEYSFATTGFHHNKYTSKIGGIKYDFPHDIPTKRDITFLPQLHNRKAKVSNVRDTRKISMDSLSNIQAPKMLPKPSHRRSSHPRRSRKTKQDQIPPAPDSPPR